MVLGGALFGAPFFIILSLQILQVGATSGPAVGCTKTVRQYVACGVEVQFAFISGQSFDGDNGCRRVAGQIVDVPAFGFLFAAMARQPLFQVAPRAAGVSICSGGKCVAPQGANFDDRGAFEVNVKSIGVQLGHLC